MKKKEVILKPLTAYHESGHGLIGILLLPQDKLYKTTIIPTIKVLKVIH
ncbi:hypothetical protein [Clostridium puniceum]|nr:hypothetical protein [Clostridium puniceum]